MSDKKINYVAEVQNTLTALNCKLTCSTVFEWSIDGVSINLDDLVNMVWSHREQKGLVRIGKVNLTHALSYLESEQKRRIFADFRDSLKFDATTKDTFVELVSIIAAKPHTMYATVLRHVVWTVKRRLFGLPDYCPLFVNIYGSAGIGKSEFLKAMFSIFPHTLKSRVTNAAELFNDERQTFRFVQCYVIVMDELSGMGKADLNKLKNMIDADKCVYRQLGFNKLAEGRNNAQLIGTSNTRLRNTITADADLRKWAELDMQVYPDADVPTKMVLPLQKFDWINLWRSVDENGPSPFHDAKTYAAFREWTFNLCQHESPHNLYLQDVMESIPGKWISKAELYDNGYCREVREHRISWGNFKEKAEKLGYVYRKRNTGAGMDVPSVVHPVLADNGKDF